MDASKMSDNEKIEFWFYQPIEEQGPDRGFTICLLIIPIYERYLRCQERYFGNENTFHSKSSVVRHIAKDLNVSDSVASGFWQVMRNGLLHTGIPKEGGKLRPYAIYPAGDALHEDEKGQLIINPYELRKVLLDLFRQDPSFWWKHPDNSIPKVVPNFNYTIDEHSTAGTWYDPSLQNNFTPGTGFKS